MGVVPPGLRIRSGESGEPMRDVLLGLTQNCATGLLANSLGDGMVRKWGKMLTCWSKGWVLSTAQSLTSALQEWHSERRVPGLPISCPTSRRNSSRACPQRPNRGHTWLWGAAPTAVRLHSWAFASRSPLQDVSRFVVSKDGIWAWDIPQNGRLVTVSVKSRTCLCPGQPLPGWRVWPVQWHSLAGPLWLSFISEHHFKL